jgi:hypothetical protein
MPVENNLGQDDYDVQILTEDGKIIIQVTVFSGYLMDHAVSQYDRIEEPYDSCDETDELTTDFVDDKNVPHEPQSPSLIKILTITVGVLIVVSLGSYFIIRKRQVETNETTALLATLQKNYHTSVV